MLFKHKSLAAKWCVTCSINTWEKSCVDNPHKTYKLTREEQDKGLSYLRCTKCGLHICNICAKLFSNKLQLLTKRLPTIPAWCQLVNSFLSQARKENAQFTIQISPEHCFSCQHKHCSDTLPLQSTSTGILPANTVADSANVGAVQRGQRQPRKSMKKCCTQNDKYHGSTKKPPTETLNGTLFFPDIEIRSATF
jgi:hypothetical protein